MTLFFPIGWGILFSILWGFHVTISKDLTSFIGKNDSGKSSILEALEIFFNSKVIKIDGDDKFVRSLENIVNIGCVFTDLPEKVIIDETNETSFIDEYLTNENEDLVVLKRFKIQKTASKPETFIIANHPSKTGYDDLHSLKIGELKKRGKELGIKDTVEDQRISAHWRKAIWSSTDNLEIQKSEIEITQLSTESKKLYTRISEAMPTFALFRSDRESSDSDPEAKDPMQLAVNEAKKTYEAQINELQEKIEKSVFEVAERTLEKMNEMDPSLANELNPRLKETPKWSFSFTIDGDENIPINKRGSGVRRLVLLNFFRAEAERKKIQNHSPDVIYAIEEPETSQHPNYQQLLIDSLIALSQNDNCQVLLTTHVPALAERLEINSIRFIEKIGLGEIKVHMHNDYVLELATESLGIMPEKEISLANKVILVEGHSDITFLNKISEEYKNAGEITSTLSDSKIYPIPIGGCGNLKHWITKRIIDKMGIEYFILMDSDLGDPVNNSRNITKINEINTNGQIGYLTNKREPENYIDPDLLKTKYDKDIRYTNTCDAKKIIGKELTIRPNDVLEFIWPHMEYQHMKKMAKYGDKDEFKEWMDAFLE